MMPATARDTLWALFWRVDHLDRCGRGLADHDPDDDGREITARVASWGGQPPDCLLHEGAVVPAVASLVLRDAMWLPAWRRWPRWVDVCAACYHRLWELGVAVDGGDVTPGDVVALHREWQRVPR